MIECLPISCSPDAIPAPRTFATLAEVGCRGLELRFSCPDASQRRQCFLEMLDLARSHNLHPASLTPTELDLFSLCHPDKDRLEQAKLTIREYIDLATDCRIDFPRPPDANPLSDNSIPTSQSPSVPWCLPLITLRAPRTSMERLLPYEQSFNTLFQSLKELACDAEAASLIIALENPAAGLLLSPLELREFIDQFNTPALGICFNPVHVAVLGDPLDWLAILDGRIVALRLAPSDILPEHLRRRLPDPAELRSAFLRNTVGNVILNEEETDKESTLHINGNHS